ncbi:MAG: methylmalonyl-CoA mutase [Deltaproteobacteria bacterium]|nr:methylmalonyl-CoA mutase [Deltaproteobacteria bacterium]
MASSSQKKGSSNQEDERLLHDFEYPTYEQWREVAEKTLKGAPFEKKLLTKTYEGITLQPVYNPDDVRDLPHMGGLPGFAPYVRGASAAGQSAEPWKICQEITYATPEEVNEALRHDLERGQTGIRVVLDRAGQSGLDPDKAEAMEIGRDGVSVISVADIAKILQGIDSESFPLHIDAGSSGIPAAALLVAQLRDRGVNLASVGGCFENDPLGMLARHGKLPRSLDSHYNEMAALTGWALQNAPSFKTISASGHPYHDAGGSAVEELAAVLATGVTYLRELSSRGLAVNDVASKMLFSVSLGGNFFVEVAKLRAARLVWAQAVEAFGGSDAAKKMTLHARTSAWNKTALDPYVNMLRATTETFSSAVGGSDSVMTSPFDEPIRKSDSFSRRIARNLQVVLQEESHMNQVVDPAGGSWYVEYLTDAIASKAWALFQDVEREGGMAKALAAGMLQNKIKETADARAKDLNTRKSTLIGTNLFPNATEKPLDPRVSDQEALAGKRCAAAKAVRDKKSGAGPLEAMAWLAGQSSANLIEAAIEAAASGATLGEMSNALKTESSTPEKVPSIQIHRGAERHERMRMAAREYEAKTGRAPAVFLANMGPIPQHKPRADFTTGFFEVGGFTVLGNDGFKTPEEAAEAAVASNADVAVICSTDDTYPELVPRFTGSLKEKNQTMKIVLAGYPKNQVEEHKKSGVDEFIHIKANNYEILAGFLKQIGVQL